MKGRDDRISGPQPLAGSAARRVEAIIEGAEQAAGRVIDDAEAKARAYLAEAEAEADRLVEERLASLGELIDALVAQADAIRRQAELLAQSLREAKDKLESEVGGGTAEAPAASPPSGPAATEPGAPASVPAEAGPAHGEEPRTPHLSAVEPVEPPARPVPPPAGEAGTGPGPRGRGTPAGARLLATQMAVSGSSRQEIATRLRNGFEIEDADAILDAILGPEA